MTKQKKTPGWHRRDVFQAAGVTVGAAALTPIVAAAAAPSEISDAITQQPTPEPGAEQNTSGILVQTLIDWGATHVFGVVGDGINSIIEALRRRQDRIRYVPVRHEEAAAFMACGFAKNTGRLGVCVGTTGPGAIHLMNGLYDAKLDGAPVVALFLPSFTLTRSTRRTVSIFRSSISCRSAGKSKFKQPLNQKQSSP